MSTFKKFTIVTMSVFLLISMCECGPLSLTIPRGFRNGREIRAPFKNSEIMVARGFGKRDVGHRDKLIGTFEEPEEESMPLEWIAKEITSNPPLARLVLHRFVDTNKDGIITARELLGTSTQMDAENEFY